jgi:phosphoribosylformylglycinamidine synthase
LQLVPYYCVIFGAAILKERVLSLKHVAVEEMEVDASRVVKAMRFVDNAGQPTEVYPFNPNGSPGGLTSVTTPDGRFTALMPHPERVFRNVQMSWTSGVVGSSSPWLRMFQNARKALG